MLYYVVEDKQAWKIKTNFYAKGKLAKFLFSLTNLVLI